MFLPKQLLLEQSGHLMSFNSKRKANFQNLLFIYMLMAIFLRI